jgi:hypothetical protein
VEEGIWIDLRIFPFDDLQSWDYADGNGEVFLIDFVSMTFFWVKENAVVNPDHIDLFEAVKVI